ncbi:MAG: flagellar hook assembly protein FlgD [Bacteroidota bacterium]
MVDSVTSSTSTSSTSSASSISGSSGSDTYNMFLQILCTELQTQNPLDPTDTTEFTSQLTSYSQLEQAINTNTKLDEVLSGFDSLSMSNGVGYIGKEVEADTDTLTVADDGSIDATWKYDLDGTAKSVTLSVVDSDGNTVWTGSGETGSGAHEFTWDGTNTKGAAVAAGDYTLKVTATDADGADVDSSISIKGEVTAVDSGNGSTILELGDTQVKMSAITRLAA